VAVRTHEKMAGLGGLLITSLVISRSFYVYF